MLIPFWWRVPFTRHNASFVWGFACSEFYSVLYLYIFRGYELIFYLILYLCSNLYIFSLFFISREIMKDHLSK
jgi:hypothetical protein